MKNQSTTQSPFTVEKMQYLTEDKTAIRITTTFPNGWKNVFKENETVHYTAVRGDTCELNLLLLDYAHTALQSNPDAIDPWQPPTEDEINESIRGQQLGMISEQLATLTTPQSTLRAEIDPAYATQRKLVILQLLDLQNTVQLADVPPVIDIMPSIANITHTNTNDTGQADQQAFIANIVQPQLASLANIANAQAGQSDMGQAGGEQS